MRRARTPSGFIYPATVSGVRSHPRCWRPTWPEKIISGYYAWNGERNALKASSPKGDEEMAAERRGRGAVLAKLGDETNAGLTERKREREKEGGERESTLSVCAVLRTRR